MVYIGVPSAYAAAAPTARGGFVGFFIWLEGTGFAEWVRSSVAGYPLMIACHAIGMGVMVGLAIVLALRLLGSFSAIPYSALQRFLGIAWLGFGVNFLSGFGLFSAQATSYLTDWVFLTKMGLVVLGGITVAYLQGAMGRDAAGWGAAAPSGVRVVAALSIVFWVGAIIMGRLTAYL